MVRRKFGTDYRVGAQLHGNLHGQVELEVV